MSKLTFDMAELAPIIEHARASKKFTTYGKKAEPGLFLAKDEGIYLMSAGIPVQMEPGQAQRRVVVYADTFKPDDPDCWDRSHDISGDDFCDLCPLEWFTRAMRNGAGKLYLHISGKSIHCTIST